jgi:TonB family protein
MSRRFQVDPFDLLGQNEIFPIAVYLPGRGEPKLSIAWNSFHQNFFSELGAFFRWTHLPKDAGNGGVFRDCRIPRRVPLRAIVAAGLWHVVIFIVPWPHFPVGPKRKPALDNAEVTWSGPIDDLPLLNVPKQKPTANAPKAEEALTQPDGMDAYHPRQRIFTDPVRPNHPRQTLVKPADPMEPPKFLTPLPNMVQIAASAGPARPHLEISEQALAKLRPKATKHVATTDTPAPDVPNMETHAADISLATENGLPAKPKLEINAGSTPRLADSTKSGEVVAAPELTAGSGNTNGGPAATIIAFSATPAPPAPVVEVPKGNLAARVAISPEGKGAGTGGGSGNGTNTSGGGGDASGGHSEGKSLVGISITGGNPKPNAGLSGLGGAPKLSLPRPQAAYKRPDPNGTIEDPPERSGPPNFNLLPPGSAPELIFSSRRVYSMNVNMPNLNSATGSWIIHFSELHLTASSSAAGELSAPVPQRKVDPKYPLTAMQEHIEGEVILYAVIRPDGTVDSIQVVRGVDPQLDANAVAALSQWKFQPAAKNGQPIPLEAIVHIPFRAPQRE